MFRRVFTVTSILVLIGLLAWAIEGYDTDWRRWQRAFFTELEQRESGPLSLLDRLRIESQITLNTPPGKIVTASGRTADMCMACHANRGVEGFEKPPLRDLNKLHRDVFVIDEMPFNEVGCTSCHGGEPQALNAERAHEFMRDRYDEIFRESIAKLNSSHQMTRQEGIETIRWMTGRDFGFSFSDPPQARRESIEQIKSWWRRHKDTFMVEGFGTRESPFRLDNPAAERIEELTHVAPTGEPLEFVGSGTCVSCHSNPRPRGVPYIPPSNKAHVERWYQQELRSSENPKTYLLNHPWLAEVLITQKIEDPQRREQLIETMRTARSQNQLPEPPEIEDLLRAMQETDVTCEACHGPGSQYSKLMTKGLALEYEGNSSAASELLDRASMIGRSNARTNLQNPAIWSLYAELTTGPLPQPAQSPSVQASAPPEDTEAPPEPTEPEEPATAEPESAEDGDAEDEADEADLVAQGRQIAQSQGCLGCHSTDGSRLVGPTWQGLFGSEKELESGETVEADAAYIRESIRQPGAKIVAGYPDSMGPYSEDQISEEDLQALIAYIRSLANDDSAE